MRLDRSKPVFLEKSPPNAARTRWLQRQFENAYFIAIVRNEYVVAEGIRRKAEPSHLRDGWPIELCARQWNRSNEVLLEDAKHLERVLWVRYEDLVREPDEELRRVLSFLELPAGEIDFRGSWAVHEESEPNRDMNADGFKRLTADDRRAISREARTMLQQFGYSILE